MFHRLCKADRNWSEDNKNALMFDTIAMVAIDGKGKLDEKKVMELIEVFRPTRDGVITLVSDGAPGRSLLGIDLSLTRRLP